jgi:hypothetical protein
MEQKHGVPVRFAIFDPLARYLPSGSPELTRQALDPLKDWANAGRRAVCGIRHPLKDGGETNVQKMISGSMAEMQTARAGYFIFPAPGGDGAKAWMLWGKGNYHAPDEKLGFETGVETWVNPDGIKSSRVTWASKRIDVTANGFLAGDAPVVVRGGKNGDGGKKRNDDALMLSPPIAPARRQGESVEAWVRRVLAGGKRVPAKVLQAWGESVSPRVPRKALFELRQRGVLDTFDGQSGRQEEWGLRA